MLQLIYKYEFAKYVLQNNSLCPSSDSTLRWLPLNLVMKSIFGVGNGFLPSINTPFLNQGWPRSMSAYGISRPHCVYLLLTVVIPTVSVRKSSAMKYKIPVCVLWYIGAERKWLPFCRRYLKFLSMNEICCILIRISLKFVPRNPIANRSVLI